MTTDFEKSVYRILDEVEALGKQYSSLMGWLAALKNWMVFGLTLHAGYEEIEAGWVEAFKNWTVFELTLHDVKE